MPVDSGGVVPELASPGDVPALAVTFAAAFGDDAMIRWPMPGATPATLQELFRVILAPYAESGVLWKIGGCDGGAAWLPPGVAGRFAEIEQSTRAAISPLTGDGGARYAAFWDWLDAHLPGGPCWFLDLAGVAPGAQGRGLGRALVRHGLARARADGCPAFLETGTPRNVPFYESFGFRVVGEQQAPDGGPVIWFMQTPPAPLLRKVLIWPHRARSLPSMRWLSMESSLRRSGTERPVLVRRHQLAHHRRRPPLTRFWPGGRLDDRVPG